MEISNWRTGEAGKSIIGEFTLRILALGMTIHEMKAFRSKKGHLYVKFPSKGKKDAMGETIWKDIVEIDQSRSAEFQKKCLEAIEPFVTMAQQKQSFAGDLF